MPDWRTNTDWRTTPDWRTTTDWRTPPPLTGALGELLDTTKFAKRGEEVVAMD